MTEPDPPGASRPAETRYPAAGVRTLYIMAVVMGVSRAFHHDATVLPVLIRQLSDEKIYAGLMSAAVVLGLFVPQFIGAYLVHHLTRVRQFILGTLLGLFVVTLCFSGVSFFIAERAPDLALPLLLLLTLCLTGCIGFAMPAQMVFFGKIVRPSQRGTFFGNETFFTTGGGILGGIVVERILDQFVWPTNFGLAFLVDGFFLLVALLIFRTIHERHNAPPPAHGSFGSYLKRMPELCRENRNFAAFLTPRTFMAIANVLSVAMIPIYCLETFEDQFTDSDAGWFAASFMLGHCLAAPVLGRFGSRHGFGKVLCLATGCQALRLFLLMVVPESVARPVVFFTFFLGGIFLTGLVVGTRNLILNFSTPDERPAYVAIVNTFRAPFLVVASILGGYLVDTFSYRVNFTLSLLAALVGIGLFMWKVRDPGPEEEELDPTALPEG